MTKAEHINQQAQHSARKAESAARWRSAGARPLLPAHVWGCQWGQPQSSCAGGRRKPPPCTLAARKGLGEIISKVKAGLLEWQSKRSCPWVPCALPMPFRWGAMFWQAALALPSPKAPLSTVRWDQASTVLRQWWLCWETSLLLYKFIITRDLCSEWRTHLLSSCGFQLISSQLTVFKYSESCKFPYHSS